MIKPTIEEVRAWLDKHVIHYPDPETITLFCFEINWETFSGTFKLKFNNVELPFTFNFSPEASGKPTMYLPMLHSPLGVPASYSALSLSDKTISGIEKAMREIIPRLKPLGKDQLTGVEITSSASAKDRIVDIQILESIKQSIQQKEHTFKV